jgi:hypothetical protein
MELSTSSNSVQRQTYKGWVTIADKTYYFKSKWEYQYAMYLDLMKRNNHIVDWFYEPHTFYFEGIKRGTTNYKPDFKVIFPSGNEEWFEVKGYMDSKSATKIKRMAKYFPEIKLRVIDKTWFSSSSKILKKIIKNW